LTNAAARSNTSFALIHDVGTYPDTYRGGAHFSIDGTDLFHRHNERIERISAYFNRLGAGDAP
jgi:hypothetical protein